MFSASIFGPGIDVEKPRANRDAYFDIGFVDISVQAHLITLNESLPGFGLMEVGYANTKTPRMIILMDSS